jgi:hypothetical protein
MVPKLHELVSPVVANGALMQMVKGSNPTVPGSYYSGSCSDCGLEEKLVILYITLLVPVTVSPVGFRRISLSPHKCNIHFFNLFQGLIIGTCYYFGADSATHNILRL